MTQWSLVKLMYHEPEVITTILLLTWIMSGECQKMALHFLVYDALKTELQWQRSSWSATRCYAMGVTNLVCELDGSDVIQGRCASCLLISNNLSYLHQQICGLNSISGPFKHITLWCFLHSAFSSESNSGVYLLLLSDQLGV